MPSMEEIIRKWTLPCWSKEDVDRFDFEAAQAFLDHLKIKEYKNKGKYLFLSVLEGACDFCVGFQANVEEELKSRDIKHCFDEIDIKSYGKDIKGGKPTMKKDTNHEIEGWIVVILEDIVDRGEAMAFAIEYYKARGAVDVIIVARIDKIVNRTVKIPNIIYGIRIKDLREKDYFYIGRGLDFLDEKGYRKIPEIRKIYRARAGWLVRLKGLLDEAKEKCPSG